MRTFKNLDEIQSIHPLILHELGKNFLNERSYVLSPQVYQEIGIYYVAKLNGLSLETVGAVTVESLRSLLCFYCLSPKPNLTKSYNKQWEKNYLKTGVEQYQRREAVLNQFLPENYNTTSAMFTLDNWHNKLINSSEKKSLEHRNFTNILNFNEKMDFETEFKRCWYQTESYENLIFKVVSTIVESIERELHEEFDRDKDLILESLWEYFSGNKVFLTDKVYELEIMMVDLSTEISLFGNLNKLYNSIGNIPKTFSEKIFNKIRNLI